MPEKPKIICLTPVKNEAWILDTFLSVTSLWADYIIIADQNSTDGSKEIVRKFSKVILVDNNNDKYDEAARQQLLLSEARKIEGRKLLITLDVDEFFTSDFQLTEEWEQIINAYEGDIFGFQWVNLLPGYKKGWLSKGHFPWAMIDDGSSHSGMTIHNPRLPVKDFSRIKKIDKIKVLHYQYVDWQRMKSKHRYYQCLERINYPLKSHAEIYRTYHHMYNIAKEKFVHIENNWFTGYEEQGINIRDIQKEDNYWFDNEVLKLFMQYGEKKFRKEAIWGVNWNKIKPGEEIKDPRTLTDRLVQIWFKLTQKYKDKQLVIRIDRFIKFHL